MAVLWANDGYYFLTYAAGEVRDPTRNLPRALIYGLLGVLAIYLTVNLAYFVALPIEPGRHTLTLPPLPISVARANNDVVTLCTKSHTIVVEDPTASTPDAQPKPNPPPGVQREEWVALERGLSWGVVGVAVGGALGAGAAGTRQHRDR